MYIPEGFPNFRNGNVCTDYNAKTFIYFFGYRVFFFGSAFCISSVKFDVCGIVILISAYRISINAFG